MGKNRRPRRWVIEEAPRLNLYKPATPSKISSAMPTPRSPPPYSLSALWAFFQSRLVRHYQENGRNQQKEKQILHLFLFQFLPPLHQFFKRLHILQECLY